ncbi:hypothetical protein FACS18948_3340 [Clostridia bacterium]|nr:hypothetical protein FACS18948_3340 [Clostridia bacterium]
MAGKVDTRVAQVSEIAEAVTVVVGNQAIACVTFDSAYRGDLTDRIAESVSTAVKQVATGVTGCSVTNSAEIADKLKTLREKQSQGGDESEIKKEFEEIKSAIK